MNLVKKQCHKTKVINRICLITLILLMMVSFSGCRNNQTAEVDSLNQKVEPVQSLEPTATTQPISTVTPSPSPTPQQVTLLAVGDDLIHQEVIDSGLKEGSTYNYDHLFSVMKNEFEAADISVINQETIFAGNNYKYSGYPTFNSPSEIGDAIVKAGFDVVLQATNHTMDKGTKGIKNTLKFWDKYPQTSVLGINKSKKDQNTPVIIEKNGIKIAMLNYTFGLNGISIPKGKEYLVNVIDKKKMKADIKNAKQKADFVIVYPHWGTEYKYKPDKKQKELTNFFAEQGVNLVIGSHPHVIEPVKWVKQKNGQRMLVYYSLGNYISYQKKAPRMLGAMAKVTLTKTEDGVIISQASVTPIVTHYEKKDNYNFGTYKLSDYTEEQANRHGVIEKEKNSEFSLNYLKDLSTEVLGDCKEINIKLID